MHGGRDERRLGQRRTYTHTFPPNTRVHAHLSLKGSQDDPEEEACRRYSEES